MPETGDGMKKRNEILKDFTEAANAANSSNVDDTGKQLVKNVIAYNGMMTQCTRELFTSQKHKGERIRAQEHLKTDRQLQQSQVVRKKFACYMCKETFSCPLVRQKHVFVNHAIKSKQCKYCAKACESRDQYEMHKNKCRKEYKNALRCKFCDYKAGSSKDLEQHNKICKQALKQEFKCPHCNKKTIKTIDNFRSHTEACKKRQAAKAERSRLVQCPKCGIPHAAYNLKNHEEHCKGNSKTLAQTSTASSTTTTQVPISTSATGSDEQNVSTSDSILNNEAGDTHSEVDTEDSAQESSADDSQSEENSEEDSEENIQNSSDEDETLDESCKEQCTVCHKKFNSVTNYRKHTCIDELNCQNCGKQCTDRKQLNNHVRTCSKMKVYQCRYCPRSFKRKDTLKKHKKNAHKKS